MVTTPEPWIERVIRDAQADGKLEVTKGAGEPIPSLSRPYDPAWWARNWTEAEHARDRAAELSRSVERALPRVLARESIVEIRSGLETLDQMIADHNVGSPDYRLPQLDIERLVSQRAGRRRS